MKIEESLSTRSNLLRVSTKSKIFINKVSVELFLDIDSKDMIYNAAYTVSEKFDGFSEYLKFVNELIGKNVFSINPQFKSKGIINFHNSLLKNCIENLNELPNRFFDNDEIKNKLVCRCFGITSLDVEKSLGSNEDFKTFQARSKASLGCGSCVEQFNLYFNNENKKVFRVRDKTISQWILEIADSLEEFQKFAPAQFNNKVLGVHRFESMKVFIDCDTDLKNDENLIVLQDYLESSVDPYLSVFWA